MARTGSRVDALEYGRRPVVLQRMPMTQFSTHRFSVGQLVSCPGNDPPGGMVRSQIAGPAYEVEFALGGERKVVQEGELTYGNGTERSGSTAGRVAAELPPRSVH